MATSSGSGPQPGAHLVESTLYKEDAFSLGHTAVWGSWYDPESKRWGYACCKGIQRDQACTVAPPPKEGAAANGEDGADSGIEVTSPDSEDQTEFDAWDFSKSPAELLPPEKVCKGQPGAYIQHFVEWIFGEWERMQERGYPGFEPIAVTKFNKTIKECQEAITPLLWRLKKGVSLDRGEEKSTKRSRETRTSMEGKFVKEKSVLDQLFKMANCCHERNYIEAHAEYMRLTFGNKMWNLTFVGHVAACTMKGAREYRRNRDSLNTYDMDPVSQKYMHAMKKLCHFAQCVRPSSDAAMNVAM